MRSLSFEAYGRTCSLKLEGCTGWADQAHHTKGRARTGDDLRYVRPACASCNGKAGDPAAAERADPVPRPLTRW